MKNLKKLSLVIVSLLVLSNPINIYAQVYSQESNPQDASLTVSATVGEAISKLFGYTSPGAEVSLITSPNVIEATQADSKGYFEFNNFYISSQGVEMCLEAVDRNLRTTSPVCIPSPSQSDPNASIGPVILAPSLSINSGSLITNQTVAATGESIPNSEITVSFFSEDKLAFIPKTYAFALPEYTIKTDDKGYYSLNLPSSSSNTFRIFSQAIFSNQPSPKSNTLTFKVFSPIWQLIFIFIILFIILASLLYWMRKHRKNSLMVLDSYPSIINDLPRVMDYQLENIPTRILAKLVKRDADRLR